MKRREMLINGAAVGAATLLTASATAANEAAAAAGGVSSSKTKGNDMTNKWMIDPNDAVLLLIDHQSGLFQLVRDMEYRELRNNVVALADRKSVV